MKKTGAWLAVRALEELGIRYTFGIPGVHNTELYDELNSSQKITPVLVTHEGGGAFMADAVSRVSSDTIGCLAIVPAAGFTHAASGIGEALLDGVPMLVVTGGVRTDTDKRYLLHGVDLLELARPLTKAAFRVLRHEEVVPKIFEAYAIATSGVPGPVLVEIPMNLLLFAGEIGEFSKRSPPPPPAAPEPALVSRAADLLLAAKRPGIFVGWGARKVGDDVAAIAELLDAPVATTLQGLAAFPADHPLHTGFGFSAGAVPAARRAFERCDGMLAVGASFSEIPFYGEHAGTTSSSTAVPKALVHVDIDSRVFDANYPAEVKIEGDAAAVIPALLAELRRRGTQSASRGVREQIARDKRATRDEWLAHDSKGRVNPAVFFRELRTQMPADSIAVLDDGNHTYLAAELFPIHRGGKLLVPTDFNAMGYAVPAAIGAKIAQPEKEVFAIVGDGCFMMTCMEIATAASRGVGIAYFVFNDGALSQIGQAQELLYNRKTCTALGALNLEGVALATGAAYLPMNSPEKISEVVAEARKVAAGGRPVIVEVAIDYSKRSAKTAGGGRALFTRLPLSDRLRIAGRVLLRKLTG